MKPITEQTKTELQHLQHAVFVAMAAHAVIENEVESIETEILKNNIYYTDPTILRRAEPRRRITEPSETFMMSKADFTDFLHLRFDEIKKRGVPYRRIEGIEDWELVIEEPFRAALHQAENLLLEFARDIVPDQLVYLFDSNLITVRKKLIDLTLKLKL